MSRYRKNYDLDDHDPNPGPEFDRPAPTDAWTIIVCLIALVLLLGIDKFWSPGT